MFVVIQTHTLVGSYYWSSGEFYTGQHSDNTMNGGGITYFADGGTYIGQYKASDCLR